MDVYNSHRPDPDTPIEETMSALATAVTSGKALCVGISSYDAARTVAAAYAQPWTLDDLAAIKPFGVDRTGRC